MAVAAATKKEQAALNGQSSSSLSTRPKTATWVYVLLVLFAVVTFVTAPVPLHPLPGVAPTIQHVFYYGWLTAMSTGLGALPFVLVPDVATFWVGISNGTCHVVTS
jgi:zinc transporter, ZIP family